MIRAEKGRATCKPGWDPRGVELCDITLAQLTFEGRGGGDFCTRRLTRPMRRKKSCYTEQKNIMYAQVLRKKISWCMRRVKKNSCLCQVTLHPHLPSKVKRSIKKPLQKLDVQKTHVISFNKSLKGSTCIPVYIIPH